MEVAGSCRTLTPCIFQKTLVPIHAACFCERVRRGHFQCGVTVSMRAGRVQESEMCMAKRMAAGGNFWDPTNLRGCLSGKVR
jgi:hypothetical protein